MLAQLHGGGPIPTPKNDDESDTVRFQAPVVGVEEAILAAEGRPHRDPKELLEMLRADDALLARSASPDKPKTSVTPPAKSSETEFVTARFLAPGLSADLDRPTIAAALPKEFDSGVDELSVPPALGAGDTVVAPDLHHQETIRFPAADGPAEVTTQSPPPRRSRSSKRNRDDGRTDGQMAITSSLAGLALVVIVFLTASAFLVIQYKDELPLP